MLGAYAFTRLECPGRDDDSCVSFPAAVPVLVEGNL
jgi:hypothetical protein